MERETGAMGLQLASRTARGRVYETTSPTDPTPLRLRRLFYS